MLKDIFIDNNIAKNFAHPLDPQYKKLVKWLFYSYHPSEADKNAYLVVSQKLLNEYHSTCRLCVSNTSIVAIVNTMLIQGRLRKFSHEEISNFKRIHYKPRVKRMLRCNCPDKEHHIPTVLMSDRKYALVGDNKLKADLVNFPGFRCLATKRPEAIPYDT